MNENDVERLLVTLENISDRLLGLEMALKTIGTIEHMKACGATPSEIRRFGERD